MEKFTIGGNGFFLSREDVEQKLSSVEPENVREVFVEVNGRRYPIKQALAVATGLLRGTFTTHDAMRVFRKLSLPVRTDGIALDTMPERCYTMIKSLSEFDKQEVLNIVRSLIATTDRDTCFLTNYYRAKANIDSLLSLKTAKDLQAIAMIARSLFELAVDTKLIDAIPDSIRKISTFADVEKLRAARKIIRHKSGHPDAKFDTDIYEAFIRNEEKRIETDRVAVWPDMKKVSHWSGLDLSQRTALLKEPFDEIYDAEYPRLSWYVHSGLTGFVNLKAETFSMLAASQNKLAGDCYMVILTSVIEEFGLNKADSRIKSKLKLAQMLPFTDSPEESRALELDLLR